MGPPFEYGGESSGSGAPSGRRQRFNGAAVRIRRRAGAAGTIVNAVRMLQWGRRSNTAESAHAGLRCSRIRAASMGPPFEYGGEGTGAYLYAPTGALASMGPPFEYGGEETCKRWVAAALAASMGPPFEYGGEPRRHWTESLSSILLQWGRRSNTAERAR